MLDAQLHGLDLGQEALGPDDAILEDILGNGHLSRLPAVTGKRLISAWGTSGPGTPPSSLSRAFPVRPSCRRVSGLTPRSRACAVVA